VVEANEDTTIPDGYVIGEDVGADRKKFTVTDR
jgi:hypothetical protein